MYPSTPEEILIGRRPLTNLVAMLQAALPQEGCALLLGQGAGARTWRLWRVWPCLNIWEPSSERGQRFCIDPREQLLAQKWGRSRGLQLLGSAHSHPATAPIPSRLDQILTLGPTLMVILGPGEAPLSPDGADLQVAGWQLACWWLPAMDGEAAADGLRETHPRRLVWRMGE